MLLYQNMWLISTCKTLLDRNKAQCRHNHWKRVLFATFLTQKADLRKTLHCWNMQVCLIASSLTSILFPNILWLKAWICKLCNLLAYKYVTKKQLLNTSAGFCTNYLATTLPSRRFPALIAMKMKRNSFNIPLTSFLDLSWICTYPDGLLLPREWSSDYIQTFAYLDKLK